MTMGRTQPIPERMAAWSGTPADRILGRAEIAQRFGVSRQRVGQIIREDRTFPRPGLHDRFGEAWVAAGVECWAAAHRPTADTGRFGRDAALILRKAEAIAERAANGWIDSTHVWLAMAHGAGGSELARAITSMGLDQAVIQGWLVQGDDEARSRRMTPALQQRMEAADRAVRTAQCPAVSAVDIALALIDTPRKGPSDQGDRLIWFAERQGLDTQELRRRIELIRSAPEMALRFDDMPLPKPPPRSRRPRRPAWLDLAPNPLGYDPWDRRPWGSAFAITREDTHLALDDRHWFFHIDGDGFFVRTTDGRPVGYRYRVLRARPKRLPGRPRMEVLPMPPFPLRDWPDRRFARDD